ncbi:hypothetical protein D3C80_1335170 [compost metagenome]
MIAFNQTNILHLSADFQHGRTAFHLQVFYDGDVIAIDQQITVGVFHDQRIAILRRFGVIPFMGAFRANEHAIIFIGVFGITFWTVWKRHIGIL